MPYQHWFESLLIDIGGWFLKTAVRLKARRLGWNNNAV